jgi:hypothetical protein
MTAKRLAYAHQGCEMIVAEQRGVAFVPKHEPIYNEL